MKYLYDHDDDYDENGNLIEVEDEDELRPFNNYNFKVYDFEKYHCMKLIIRKC